MTNIVTSQNMEQVILWQRRINNINKLDIFNFYVMIIDKKGGIYIQTKINL
jgi:hypothetical protein